MTEFKPIPTRRNVNERMAANRADTTTPLGTVGKAPLADVPDPPPALELPRKKQIILSVTIPYRGRVITISGEGFDLDAFCDLLDKRLGAID